MRLIDADTLEREGWYLSRNYEVDSKTRCFETKAIKEVPTAHPELNEWCHDCKEYDHDKHCCPRWNQVIRTTLEEAQPERKTGKWIPCIERLPDAQTEVIVSCMDDSGDTRFFYTSSGWVTTDREYWIVDNEINSFVIAWMPLPEPWRGEER